MQSVVVFFALVAVVSAGVITQEKATVSHEQNPAGFAYQTSEYKSAQTLLPAAVPTYYGAAPAAVPYAYSYVNAYEPAPAAPAFAVKHQAVVAAPAYTEVKYDTPVVKEYKFEAPTFAAAPVVKTEYKYEAPAPVVAPVVKTEYKYETPVAVKAGYAYKQPVFYNYAPAAAPTFYKYPTAPAFYNKYPAAPFVPTYYNAAPYYGYNYGYQY